jgi:SAM-dependent methyltransferase
MNLTEYVSFADKLAHEAKVENGLHSYFLTHRDRLWQTATHFDIWSLRGKRVLEIGPFFSYTPFALQDQGNQVSVLEGDDPAVNPLKPLYRDRRIDFATCDLFRIFGSPSSADHRLPFPDDQFDVIYCWETMEHFNFNPVGFVRDLRRILKSGGEVCITVPNVAKMEKRVRLFLGGAIATPIADYRHYYDYAGGVFLGFHWREYTLPELVDLFEAEEFQVVSAGHLSALQNYPKLTMARRLWRFLFRSAFILLPSLGSQCALRAKKLTVSSSARK